MAVPKVGPSVLIGPTFSTAEVRAREFLRPPFDRILEIAGRLIPTFTLEDDDATGPRIAFPVSLILERQFWDRPSTCSFAVSRRRRAKPSKIRRRALDRSSVPTIGPWMGPSVMPIICDRYRPKAFWPRSTILGTVSVKT